MTKTRIFTLSCAAIFTTAAYSQTWVSGSTGNDAASCTRTAPCKTFQRAVNVTPAWGQVSVADPGDFGSVTITTSMTIDGGNFASNVTTSGTSITVNTGSGIVQLRNLSVHGNGASAGIHFTSGAQLVIENVKVNGFGSACISALLTAAADIVIKDTSIDNCSGYGITIQGPQALTAEISNTHVHYANGGLAVFNGTVTVSNSSFSSPSGDTGQTTGILGSSDGGNSNVLIDNCTITGFGGAIAVVGNAGNSIQVSRSTISNTFDALSYAVGTSLISNGNNTFFNNVSLNNGFSKTVVLQ